MINEFLADGEDKTKSISKDQGEDDLIPKMKNSTP